MQIPERGDPIWSDIILGKKEFVFEFLALKIFIGFAQFQYKNTPTHLSQLADDLYNIFAQNSDMPVVINDLRKLTEDKENSVSGMRSTDELEELIQNGQTLLLAGDEKLLDKLPRGNWIGGTIPYFNAPEGGIISKEKVFVTTLPSYVEQVEICSYDEKSIENIYVDSPANGFSFLILPAGSPTHLSFALNAPRYKNFAVNPVVGWVAGVHLSDLGKFLPKIINGKTGEVSFSNAIVMRCSLPNNMICNINTVNIFSPGNGDTFEVMNDGFSFNEVIVNGHPVNFVDYLLANKVDLKLPLVANYYGVNINVSFQEIDREHGVVTFYAPLFKGVKYCQANPVIDYVKDFIGSLPKNNMSIIFSCNCILNFLYSELEGKACGTIGPITFGEIAYQLLNQTMVYLTINERTSHLLDRDVGIESQLQEKTEELTKVKKELEATEKELSRMLPQIESSFTELKQAQQKLADIINFLPDPTFVIDQEGKVISWNRSVEIMTGIKAADMIGKGNYEYALPFYHKRRMTLIDYAKEGSGNNAEEYYDIQKDGNTLITEREFENVNGKNIFVWIKATPMYNDKGEVIGAIESVRDITAQKLAERKIEEMNKKLLHSEKMASLGMLSAGVAHEINNPLGFIISNFETVKVYLKSYNKIIDTINILAKTISEEAAEKTLKQIGAFNEIMQNENIEYIEKDIEPLIDQTLEGLNRVKKIVSDLKTFAHADPGELGKVDINAVIDAAINICWNELKYKAELTKEYGQIPLIQCSKQKMEQVFVNLLINAGQAIEKRGTIFISTGVKGDKAHIKIVDSGQGISQENILKIFDPFFSTKPVGQGTGMGLSISYDIIKQQEGEFQVESTLGAGTTFTVILPLSDQKPYLALNP